MMSHSSRVIRASIRIAMVRDVDLFCARAFASAALDTAIITKASLSSIIHGVCVAPLRAGVRGGRAAAGRG